MLNPGLPEFRQLEWEVKVNKTQLEGNLTNNGDGTFTASVNLNQFPTGNGKVTIKLEDKNRNKSEVRDEPITIAGD